MFIGQLGSGLSEDRVVNTFHFIGTAGGYAADAPVCLDAVEDFYNGVNVTHSVGSWLSPYVKRAAELRSYNLALPVKERAPTIRPITLQATAGGSGYAEEVATCVTLEGVGRPVTRRRRGRIYIGPLTAGAVESTTGTAPCRPTSSFVTDLLTAAARMTDTGVSGAVWAIRSTVPAENFVIIGGGYVDNALDTQRRRGPKTTARSTWLGTTVTP